jgi:site-specific recombinase XerD
MNKIHILFFQRASLVNYEDVAYIYCRVTINKKRAQFATGLKCPPRLWNPNLKRIDKKWPDAKEANKELIRIESRLLQIFDKMSISEKEVSAQNLVDKYLGKSNTGKTILEVFRQHNAKMKSLIGIEYAQGTLTRFETTYKHLALFLKSKYKSEDLEITRLDNQFIHDFDYFLRTQKSCANNTTVKYIKNLTKIVRICCDYGWLESYPFTNYKQRTKEVDRVFLTKEELDLIYAKDFDNSRLEGVRDLFVFSCYTGLAYIDVQRLTSNNIVVGIDGNKWININRKKTDIKSSIPLLPVAEEILYKYEELMKYDKNQRVLPCMSNQKLNAYLKEIAVICNINKELTFHIARHTFATTVTLTNGVPIESVSKMLGHSSIKMTQHYAKIVDRKLSDDMMKLREKLQGNNSKPTNPLRAIR